MLALTFLTTFFLFFPFLLADSHGGDSHGDDPSDLEGIRYTINLYPFIIDAKNWNALDRVFTQDVQANYSIALGFLDGLAALEAALSQPANADTMHTLSTQTIDITGHGKAAATTYVTAWFFGRGVYLGQFFNVFARYDDTLVKGNDKSWKINKRNVVFLPNSPLYTLTPPEIRTRIFEYTVTATDLPDRAYKEDSYHYRPGYTHRQRIDTSLLLTCRLIYLETRHLPLSQNELVFYYFRGPRHLFTAPQHFFPTLNEEQRDAVSHVHLFTQQYWLEGSWEYSPWRNVTLVPEMRPKKVTITLRHTDWWNWEEDEPLGIDPRLPYRVRSNEMLSEDPNDRNEKTPDRARTERAWGYQFKNIQGLREVVIELETVERKIAELNAIVKRAKGWRFQLADGRVLIRDEDQTRSYTWRGSEKFHRLAVPVTNLAGPAATATNNLSGNSHALPPVSTYPPPPPPLPTASPANGDNSNAMAPANTPTVEVNSIAGDAAIASQVEVKEPGLSMHVVVMHWSAWTVDPDSRPVAELENKCEN
ncbi:MAG: hypothetical protein M1839_004793 [Geoglossum umbratile]|nr:MAG: hypothetical protein M1839_004793 [Geoglossum umbratile]